MGSTAGVQGAGTWQSGIQRNQQIQGFCLPHFAHHDSIRAHAKGFFHKPPQGDLTGSLEAWTPALEAHVVWNTEIQLKRLLHTDNPFLGWGGSKQGLQHGGFSRLGCPRHENASACLDGSSQVLRCLCRQDRAGHQVSKLSNTGGELTNIDTPVLPGDIGNDHVHPGAITQ
ncbi:MAG: Uncharacterised protein [Cellulomonadaceae bacterium TMED98]|nr:MAG: Uncharacterised protein [Cellulomonadaceae bacterium TMED98]